MWEMKSSDAAQNSPLRDDIETADGWKLAVYRYPRRSKSHPVLLIHGLGTNRYDVDFPDPHYSLAKYLHRKGFDTWIVELRGAGLSRKKGWRLNWTFDDYVTKDLPAAVRHIQSRTGHQKLHWAGHSLGGTLVYAAIETLGNEVCASGVTLGAAMGAVGKVGLIKFLLKVDPFVKRMPCVPMKGLARLGLPLARWMAPLEDNFFYAADNIDLNVLEKGLEVAVENVSSALFLQLHDWYKHNHFRSRDRSYSYRRHLKDIRAPFLVCAGSVDGLTAYPDVHCAYREIGSHDKSFRVFSRENGCRTEYGHMDLVLGRNAPREVFPAIADWMKNHD
jgi:poly(3-hydroxyalkanoate) synthetase